MFSCFVGVMAAIMWPAALIGVAGVMDNPWSVCTHRTEMAGKQLAEVLLSRTQVCADISHILIRGLYPFLFIAIFFT